MQKQAGEQKQPTLEQAQKQQEQQQAIQEQKSALLGQILTAQAKERLGNIKLVKADKAEMIENYLLKMAQSGQIKSQVGEEQLIQLLKSYEGQKVETKVKFQRRSIDDDDDYELPEN